ncbi:MAG: AMP-binding protein, partial [Sphingomonadaceae bacterium]|nr:AMP-binding protein [Sphingomonadaceae bacterium]
STAPRRILLPMPFFHVTGFHSTLMPAMANGATIHLMYKWDVARALDIIARERINGLNLVPTLAWQLSDAISPGMHDTSSVDLVGYGGAAAAPELAQRMRDAFPNAYPGQGYGATETSSLVAANSHEDMMARPGSVGTAVPCCDLRVVDASGNEVPPGEAGELWVRGPKVVTGYWNMPEATEDAFGGGWYRTGDVVRIDAEGFITVLDRVKDMLIRGGENIYCVEIEDCLSGHPDVQEAAVFGLPERVLGEVVAAAVRLRAGAAPDFAELAGHVRARLAAHKVPVTIDFYDAPLPRNAAGKLLKREMRARLLDQGETA